MVNGILVVVLAALKNSVLVIACAKEVMFSVLFVRLFGSRSTEKSDSQIFIKLCGRMCHGPGKTPLNFEVDLNHGADTHKLFSTFVNIAK